MSRRSISVRVIRPGDPSPPDPVRDLTSEERLEMVWPLTLAAWEFMGEPVIERRLSRHVVSVVRRER